MKGNISKNARTDRRKAEKLKYDNREVDPILIYGHFGSQGGKIMGAMFCDTKKIAKSITGQILPWTTISASNLTSSN